MLRKFLTFVILMVMLAPSANALTFDQARKLAAERAKKSKQAIHKVKPEEIKPPPKVGIPVETETKPSGRILSAAELLVLEVKISNSPAAIKILHGIVLEGRSITLGDKQVMEEVAGAEAAREMYNRLIK